MPPELDYRDQMWYSGIVKPPLLEPGQNWDMEMTYAEAGGASKDPRTKPRLRIYISQRDDDDFFGIDSEFIDGHLIFEPVHTEDKEGMTHHVFRVNNIVFTEKAGDSLWHIRCYLMDAPIRLDSSLAMIFVLDKEKEAKRDKEAKKKGAKRKGPLNDIYGSESNDSDISLHLRKKA